MDDSVDRGDCTPVPRAGTRSCRVHRACARRIAWPVVERALQGERFLALSGAPSAGKSIMARAIHEELLSRSVTVFRIERGENGSIGSRSIICQLLDKSEAAFAPDDVETMFDTLLASGDHGRRHAIIIDDAERLRPDAAVVFVSGQPSRLFSSVPPDSGLHFLAAPLTNALAATYLPAEFTHASYPDLIAEGAPVPTIAVGSVMAVFAWQPNNERYAKVARFVDAFFTKFPELLKSPRHPKWKDVNLAAKVPGWSRFPPAQDDLTRQVVAGHTDQTLRGQFAAFLAKSGVKGPLSDAQTGAMFRQFLDWQDQAKASH